MYEASRTVHTSNMLIIRTYEAEFIDKLILEVFSNFSQCVATKIVKFVAKDMCLSSVV